MCGCVLVCAEVITIGHMRKDNSIKLKAIAYTTNENKMKFILFATAARATHTATPTPVLSYLDSKNVLD